MTEVKDDKALDEMTIEELEAIDAAPDAQGTDDADVKDVEADPETETPDGEDQTTDTPDDDTDTETPDYAKMFTESGLEKQYPGGITEMFSRMPETNKYLRELREDNKELKEDNKKFRDDVLERLKPKEVEQTSEDFHDKFYENPVETMKDKGFSTADDLKATDERLKIIEDDMFFNGIANDIGKYPEFKDISDSYRLKTTPKPGQNVLWDSFIGMIDKYSGLDKLPLPTKLELFFDNNKSTDKPTEKPPVKPLSTHKKKAAKTTTPSGGDGSPNLDNMTAEALLKYAQDNSLYD